MTRGAEGLQGFCEMGFGDEHPVRVEGGEGEDGDLGLGEGMEEGREDAGEGEGEWADEFEAGPAGLGLGARGTTTAGQTMESSLGVRVRERIPDPEAAAQAGRG